MGIFGNIQIITDNIGWLDELMLAIYNWQSPSIFSITLGTTNAIINDIYSQSTFMTENKPIIMIFLHLPFQS